MSLSEAEDEEEGGRTRNFGSGGWELEEALQSGGGREQKCIYLPNGASNSFER